MQLVRILAVAGSTQAIACAALLGLEEGAPTVGALSDAGEASDSGPASDARTDDASASDVVDASSGISGTLSDIHGLPVAGATVRVRSAGRYGDTSSEGDVVTDFKGEFRPSAAPTYDLYVKYKLATGEIRTFVYASVSSRKLKLQLPFSLDGTERTLDLRGKFGGSSKDGVWSLAAGEALSWGSPSTYLPNPGGPGATERYSIERASYFTNSPGGAVVGILRVLTTGNAAGNRPYLLGSSMNGTNFLPTAGGTNVDLTVGTASLDAGALNVSAVVPAGVTLVSLRKQLLFGGTAPMDYGEITSPSGGQITTDAPKLAGATFNLILKAEGIKEAGEATYAWVTGLVADGPSASVDLPPTAPKLSPPTTASTVLVLPFSGAVGGLREVRLACAGADGTVNTTTGYTTASELRVSTADLTSLGASLGRGQTCSWTVKWLSAFSSIDDAVSEPLGRGYYEGSTSSFFSMPMLKGWSVTSKRGDFTIP